MCQRSLPLAPVENGKVTEYSQLVLEKVNVPRVCLLGLPCPWADKLGTERAASLVKAEQRMSLEGEGFRWCPGSGTLVGGRRRFCWGGMVAGALCVDRSPTGKRIEYR